MARTGTTRDRKSEIACIKNQNKRNVNNTNGRKCILDAGHSNNMTGEQRCHCRRRRRRGKPAIISAILTFMAANAHGVAAQTCIPLAGSTTCPAFASASIAPNDTYLIGLFSFLSSVTDRQSFDTSLQQYLNNGWPRRYTSLYGCSNINLNNATDLYARYTKSYICNSIVQISITQCGTSVANSQPLCADSCAEFALSEQTIISSPDLCGTTGPNAMKQLRADFTSCALPANSITGSCIPGYVNEPNDCGFSSNLEGLCTYCNASTINSTDSCCVTSDVTSRCQGVQLPSYTSMQPLFTTTMSASPSSTSSAGGSTGAGVAAAGVRHGLSGGQIAGIVVGSILGAALLLGLLLCCCLFLRRRHKKQEMSSLNQPSPPRSRPGPQMAQFREASPTFQALPGSRVTRMSALESTFPGISPSGTNTGVSPNGNVSSSGSGTPVGAAVAAGRFPTRGRTRAEGMDGSSPESMGYVSQDAPESEQLESFKDYYSSDEIHPGDLVSTLWAYQPRAPDEFELERGDMIKIVGIWDDGWATGVQVDMRADEWIRRDPLRDSGVSSSQAGAAPIAGNEIKAFPLVCVCLPQHWRRTIEGDTEPPSSDSPPY